MSQELALDPGVVSYCTGANSKAPRDVQIATPATGLPHVLHRRELEGELLPGRFWRVEPTNLEQWREQRIGANGPIDSTWVDRAERTRLLKGSAPRRPDQTAYGDDG